MRTVMLSAAKHLPICRVAKQCYEILRFAQNDTDMIYDNCVSPLEHGRRPGGGVYVPVEVVADGEVLLPVIAVL